MRKKKIVIIAIALLSLTGITGWYLKTEIFGFYPRAVHKSDLAEQIRTKIESAKDGGIDIRGIGSGEEWDEIAVIPAYQDACDLKIEKLLNCDAHSPTDDSLCLLIFLKANQFQFEVLTHMKWDFCKDDKRKRILRPQVRLRQ
jgi:hypothetical protein